jgi:hypothetical protein
MLQKPSEGMVSQVSVLRFARCLAIALALPALALVFISFLMAPLWHAYHGSTVTVVNWRLEIPKGYSEFGHNSYFAFSFGAPFLSKSYGHISVFTHEVSARPSQQRIETAVVSEAELDGYILKERRTVQSSLGSNYCFQFADRSQASKVAVRCVSSSGELWIFFEGNQRFSDSVYEVVRGASQIGS